MTQHFNYCLSGQRGWWSKRKSHHYWWLAGSNDLAIGQFQKWLAWWIVAFLRSELSYSTSEINWCRKLPDGNFSYLLSSSTHLTDFLFTCILSLFIESLNLMQFKTIGIKCAITDISLSSKYCNTIQRLKELALLLLIKNLLTPQLHDKPTSNVNQSPHK